MGKLFISCIVVFGGLFFYHHSFAYYESTTHPALSQEIVDFYNGVGSASLTPQQKEWIIQGSMLEDTDPRWLNHFYDPIREAGWSGEHAGDISPPTVRSLARVGFAPSGVVSAVQWVNNRELQLDYKLYGGDRTWGKALEYYARGNEEQAYITLGHILHLLEDMSVPDHTRNDTHAHVLRGITGDPGSPYEEYTNQYTRQTIGELGIVREFTQQKIQPISKSSIEEYLISLAEYSNRYFFSKDTISTSTYQFPQIVREGSVFGYGIDENSKEFPLIFITKTLDNQKSILKSYSLLYKEQHYPILDAYFSRLARKTVQYGAGVIQLFHTQGAEARELARYPRHVVAYDFSFLNIPMISIGAEARSLWGSLSSGVSWAYDHTIGSVVGWFSDDGFEEVGVVPRDEVSNELSANVLQNFSVSPPASAVPIRQASSPSRSLPAPQTISSSRTITSPIPLSSSTLVIDRPISEDIVISPSRPTVLQFSSSCGFQTSESPRHTLVLNEIAWMGTAESSSNEWIELRNVSGSPVDLRGWRLMDQGEDIDITFDNGFIPAGGLYLLERTDDTSVPSVVADAIYVGALSNTNEGLRLFDADCHLIDEVFASPAWPAGDAATRTTMERGSDLLSWRTSVAAGGTPRVANSQGQIANSSVNTGGSPTPDVRTSSNQNEVVPTSTPEILHDRILISEIQAGSNIDADYEFIELYNPGEVAVDLSGWDIKKKSSSGSVLNLATNMSGTIAGHGFFLVGSREFASTSVVVPDFVYTQGSNHLAYENNRVVVYDSQDVVVDEFAYSEIPTETSLERRAVLDSLCVSAQGSGEFFGNGCDTNVLGDWESRMVPRPQNIRNFLEPRVSSAIQQFTTAFSASTMELIFDWASSTPSVAEYIGYDGVGTTSTLLFTTTSTNVRMSISEVGRDHVFLLRATDEEGFVFDGASTTLTTPPFLSSLTPYVDPRSPSSSPEYFINMTYSEYPFLPARLVAAQDEEVNYKALVFFLNHEAPTSTFLDSPQFQGGEIIPVSYRACDGSVRTASSYLILPDNPQSCNIFIGGFANSAVNYQTYLQEGDFRLHFALNPSRPLTSGDYITVGYYGFYRFYPAFSPPGPDGLPNFKLIAADRTHYPISDFLPLNQSPQFVSSSLDIVFQESDSRIFIVLPSITDPDSLDSLLQYEINFSTSTDFIAENWQEIPRGFTTYDRAVQEGDAFLIGVRAKDDFGNYSLVMSSLWESPTSSVPAVE